mgnify:CR=1 FL=1
MPKPDPKPKPTPVPVYTPKVRHGAVHLHSLGPLATVEYRGAMAGSVGGHQQVALTLTSLDAPIVSAGLLTPFPTPSDNATIGEHLSGGMHWNCHNNICARAR